MESPVQISFKGFDGSDSLRALVGHRAERLERFFDRITHCQVVVEQPDRHGHKGGHYDVRIHVGLPGHELVVDHAPGRRERHLHAEPAVRDAFDAMEKQVRAWVERVRGDVKTHDRQALEGPEASTMRAP